MTEDRNADPVREPLKYLSQELQNLGSPPTQGLGSLFATWIVPIREVMESVNQMQSALFDWVQAHREEIDAFRRFLENAARFLVEIGEATDAASKAVEETLKRVEGLAQLGWTFPTHLSIKELKELVQLGSAAEVEAFMLEKLEKADPQLERTECRLLGDQRLKDFGTLIPQCFRAIRSGDYAIAVPNLIAMIENVIVQLNPPHLVASTEVTKTLKKGGPVARQVEHDLFCGAIWFSLLIVTNQLWKQYPLSITGTNSTLSRPAIQHGRIEPPNSKVEILRLLATLETGLALHEQLEGGDSLNFSKGKNFERRERAIIAMFRASFYLPRGE